MFPQFHRGAFYPSPLAGGGTRPLGSLRLPMLSGVVAKYDHPYHFNRHWEIVRRGAFSLILSSKPAIKIWLMHEPKFSLPGTVSLQDSSAGLIAHFYLADTRLARDLICVMRRGFLTSLSPSWPELEYTLEQRNGETFRSIHCVRCMPEISFVDLPAQDCTFVGINGERRHDEPLGLPSDPAERQRLQEFLSSIDALERRKPKARVFPSQPSRPKPAIRRQSTKDSWSDLSAELITGFGGHQKFAKLLQQLSGPQIPAGFSKIDTQWAS